MQIKNCPFCEIELTHYDVIETDTGIGGLRSNEWKAVCPNSECGAEGPCAETKKLAIKKWNNRKG